VAAMPPRVLLSVGGLRGGGAVTLGADGVDRQ
jgi:hypothetical protein